MSNDTNSIQIDTIVESRNRVCSTVYGASHDTIYRACIIGDFEGAVRLITNDSIKLSNPDGDTLLHYLCYRSIGYGCQEGREKIADLLIGRGALLNPRNNRGETPLHNACLNECFWIAKFLAKKGAISRSSSDDIALNNVCHSGKVELAVMLVEGGSPINARDCFGRTPLFCALFAKKQYRYQLAKFLISNGALVNIKDDDNNVVLHKACTIGDLDVVNLILNEDKSLVNERNIVGFTPLHNASSDTKIAKLLIKNGAIPNPISYHRDGGETPLHKACYVGNLEMVKLLIRNGAIVNAITDRIPNSTLLHYVCFTKFKVFSGNSRWNPMVSRNNDVYMIESLSCMKIIDLLVKKGVDVNAVNKYGETPLHSACNSGYSQLAESLIDNGALVNALDDSGNTPLHSACLRSRKINVSILIRRGASKNIPNKRGDTPLSIACKNKALDIVEMLANTEADICSFGNYLEMTSNPYS